MKKFGMMRRILSLFLGAVSFSSQGVYADKKRKDAGTKLTRTESARRNNKGKRKKNDVIKAIKDAKNKGYNVKAKRLKNGGLKVTIKDKKGNTTTYIVSGLMVLAVLSLLGIVYWKYQKSENNEEEQDSKDQKEKKHEKKDEVDETKKKTENEKNETELEDKEEEKLDQEDNKDKEEEDNKELEDKDNLQEEIDKSEEYALEQDGPREDMSNFIYNAFREDSKNNTASVMRNFNYEFCYSNHGNKFEDHVIKKAKPFMPVLLNDKYFDGHITVKDFENVYKERFCIDEILFGYYGMNSGMFKLSPGGASYTGEMCKLSEDDLKKYSVSDIAFAMICNVLHGDLEYARGQIYNNNGNLEDGFREIDYSGYFLNEEAGNMKKPNFGLLLLESKVYLLKRKIEMLKGSPGSDGRVRDLEDKLKSAGYDLDYARKHALELVKKNKETVKSKNMGVEINSDDDDSDYEV